MRLEPLSALAACDPLPHEAELRITAREKTDAGCVLINAAVPADTVLETLTRATGMALPLAAGATVRNGTRTALWLTPRSWLVLCAAGDERALIDAVGAAFADQRVHALPYADAMGWIELDGTGAEPMLAEGGFVSLEPEGLPVGHAKRTAIAGIAAIVLRAAQARWLLGVERSRAGYLATWIAQACARARKLGGWAHKPGG